MGKQRRGRPEGWRQWRAHAARARDRLGVSAGWCDWTQSSTFNKGNFTERELDCIGTAWAARLASLPFGAPPSVAKKDWWVNPTQGVQRSPWSDIVRTQRGPQRSGPPSLAGLPAWPGVPVRLRNRRRRRPRCSGGSLHVAVRHERGVWVLPEPRRTLVAVALEARMSCRFGLPFCEALSQLPAASHRRCSRTRFRV